MARVFHLTLGSIEKFAVAMIMRKCMKRELKLTRHLPIHL